MVDKVDQNDLHDDEGIHVEEAAETQKMGKDEKASIEATGKMDDSIKRAPARKGDKKNGEASKLKTRAGKIGAMYTEMNKMSSEDLEDLYSAFMEEDGEEVSEESFEESVYNYSGELNALVESEATLSEEFKEKTAVIFEAALNSKIAEEVSRIEETYQENLDEAIQETRDEMVEKVDSYLNYVVEQWMEENKLAVEAGIRTEIAEDFMASLKDLFVESYITVPESKVDLVDELAEQVEELESRLNETTQAAIEMAQDLEMHQRKEIVAEAAYGLADTEVEKLLGLVENVDFDGAEEFASKVETIKETYFTKAAKKVESLEESVSDDVDEAPVSSSMERYISAIRKSNS